MPELLLPLDGRLVRHTIARSWVYSRPLAALQSPIACPAGRLLPERVGIE